MPKLKNPRHEAFALASSSGACLRDAYEDAGFRGGLTHAFRLARRNEVTARVAELRLEQADLDEARPTAVIIALVRVARKAELLGTPAGVREARLTLLEAQRLHRAQTVLRSDARLTVLDDDEWDAVFRAMATPANDNEMLAAAPPSVA